MTAQPIVFPKTREDLELLIYRHRSLSSAEPTSENASLKVEIERVLSAVSAKQDLYNAKLEKLRAASANSQINISQDKVREFVVRLNRLARDVDTPALTTAKPEANKNIRPSLVNEPLVSNRICQRIKELEEFPANIGSYDIDGEYYASNEIPSYIDQLKLKALIELKSLHLLQHQKRMRQSWLQVSSSRAHNKESIPLTLAAQRAIQVRDKNIVPQTARLAEELERQQLAEKRKLQRSAHLVKLHASLDNIAQILQTRNHQHDRRQALGRQMANLHSNIEKEEAKRMERTAKQRLAALKSNDEEAYLKLLDQTKDTRITHLLRQTNSFLDSLAQKVRVQQQEAGGASIEEDREKIDYYEVAHRVKEEITKQPSILIGGTLKEYQLKGLEWMVSLYNNHLNGILADEMGLGKTIQSLSLITYLIEQKKEPGPYLVIVPLSTITNWTLEFEKWAPSVKTIVYKGTPQQRRNVTPHIRAGDFQVLLTTYEYIIKEKAMLGKIKWTHMIIDEGHRMKNSQSKLSQTIGQYYHTRNRLILTGTPLQNNLPELWALLNFVLPKIFNSAMSFDEWFNTPFANTGGQEKLELNEEETLLIIRRLHKVLRPFLLRRLKKEVEKDLPDKVEKVIKCKLSGLQYQLYQQMLRHNALFVGAEQGNKSGLKGLNNKIMQLRKICNHPFVFDSVEGLIPPTPDVLTRVSGKFELLDRVLPKLKASGHKVLIFFQMTQVMDIMEDYLYANNLKYMRLDGSTKADDRQDMLKSFNHPDSEYFCFLLSTRAGGLGLNLQSADTVIIFDSDWNPHQDLQAQDRAHRIGQKNEVRILRLISTDSVEEIILERAMEKLALDGKVIQAGKFDNKSTAEEQEEFLRRLLEDKEDEEESGELDDEELNDVLARGDHEKVLFSKMDEERYARDGPNKNRLITIDELPAVFKEDIEQHLAVEAKVEGRREKKRVYYDDGLTEEQWLNAVDDDNIDVDDVIKKKREAREKRQKRKRTENNGDESSEEEPDEYVEEAEEPVKVEPVKPAKPARAAKAAKPAKKAKTVVEKPPITEKGLAMIEEMKKITADDGHLRYEIFFKLPSKKLYPDYYKLIAKPMAVEVLVKNLKKGLYQTTEEFAADLKTMFENARFYNEEGSWVWVDADELDKWSQEQLAGM